MSTLFLIASITIFAAMSPGPDFFIVMKNAAAHGSRSGIWTSLGIGLALVVHSVVIGIGLGAIIETSVYAYQIIKIGGALYLLYLAGNLLLSKKSPAQSLPKNNKKNSLPKQRLLRLLGEGFLTNILNPKALIFILTLYAQVFGVDTTFVMYLLGGVTMGVVSLLWFGFLSLMVGNEYVKAHLDRFEIIINRVFGVLLGAVGVKILTQE